MSTKNPRWRCLRPGCPIEGQWQPGLEPEMDAHILAHHRDDEETRDGR